jgi:hypothetical protein
MPQESPFSVYNALGQCVLQSEPDNETSSSVVRVQVPTNEWPEGTYVVRSGPNAFKMVIQR